MHWDWNIAWLTFSFVLKIMLQVGMLAWLIYWVMRMLKGTVVPTIVYAMLMLLVGGYALTKVFNLEALQFLLERLLEYLPIFIVILMGNEIRKLLSIFSKLVTDTFVPRKKNSWYDDMAISALSAEVVKMSLSKTGALIAIEQKTPLDSYMENAKVIHAVLEPGNSLLESIFFKGAPLHDGGVIIRKGQVAAASCVFPLSDRAEVQRECGMRHQAAYGMAEATDAVVIVVSEETGAIEVLRNNERTVIQTQDELQSLLHSYMGSQEQKGTFWLSDLLFFRRRSRALYRLARKKGSAGVVNEVKTEIKAELEADK